MISEALNGCPEVVPDRLTTNQKVGSSNLSGPDHISLENPYFSF